MGYSDIKELLKDAKNLATGANDLQLKSLLLDIQDKVFELQAENKNLREELHELKNDKIMDSQLEFHEGYYIRTTDKRKICSKCWDSERKMISTSIGELGQYCPVCNMYVG